MVKVKFMYFLNLRYFEKLKKNIIFLIKIDQIGSDILLNKILKLFELILPKIIF